MKLISWNVNGIRAVLKKGFLDFVKDMAPDILCLQETKANADQVDLELPEYRHYWNAAEKKGYSGTAVFTKIEPREVTYGLGLAKHDKEGRVITLEFDPYYLVNVYTPNSQRGLERLEYRTQQWDVDFLQYVKRLEKQKPVVFCGDLNTAHKEIDLARPKANVRNAGFTVEERRSLDQIVQANFIDTFRQFTPEGGHYTWWSYQSRARERNIGWRIDYIFISTSLRKHLTDSTIHPEVLGSDHCPVAIRLESPGK